MESEEASSMNSMIACKLCTFLSPKGTLLCICGKILDESHLNGSQTALVRICQSCTFHNTADSVICSVCEETIENYVIDIIVDMKTVMESQTNNRLQSSIQQSNVAGPSGLKRKKPKNICSICYTNQNEFMIPICGHIPMCNICAAMYFTEKIATSDPYSLRCPIPECNRFSALPDKSVYFKLLTPVLERILDDKTFHEFSKKTKTIQIMRLHSYARTPCCNRAFTATSKITNCRKCSLKFCSHCCKKLETERDSRGDHIRCKKFEAYLQNDYQEMGMFAFCLQCKNKYLLERCGCMHMTCNECSFEQCSFCQQKFVQKNEKCEKPNCIQGLHAHHPRACMYYLREMASTRLEELLQMHSVNYDKNPSNQEIGIDDEANYTWYLGELVNKHKIDPVDIMNIAECLCELNRHNIPMHKQESTDYEDCVEQLRNLIRMKIPY